MGMGMGMAEWCNLPSDVVHLISTKLSDLGDLIRLRAVCKTWRLAVPQSNPSSPCQLPWLIALRPTRTDLGFTDKICYYSLSSNKTYQIQLPHPQPEDTYFLGAAGGRLLCCQRYSTSLSLFNPLTLTSLSLPPSQDLVLVLVIVSSLLQEEVMALSGPFFYMDNICFNLMRPGDDHEAAWISSIPSDIQYYEAVSLYHQGFYYINDYGSELTTILDATTEEIVADVRSPPMLTNRISRQYILECNGNILIICRHFNTTLEDVSFSIFRLDVVHENYQWIKVTGIDDQILFLNRGTGFSLPSNNFSGFKGNCIYFLDTTLEHPTVLLCRHDLQLRTTEKLPNFFGGYGTWFIPKFA